MKDREKEGTTEETFISSYASVHFKILNPFSVLTPVNSKFKFRPTVHSRTPSG